MNNEDETCFCYILTVDELRYDNEVFHRLDSLKTSFIKLTDLLGLPSNMYYSTNRRATVVIF